MVFRPMPMASRGYSSMKVTNFSAGIPVMSAASVARRLTSLRLLVLVRLSLADLQGDDGHSSLLSGHYHFGSSLQKV